MHEDVARSEREKREHHRLLHLTLRAHQHDAVATRDDDIVVAEVVRFVRVPEHLSNLVLEGVLIEVPLGALLGHDAIGDDDVHLVAVESVSQEDHVEQISLMVREQRLHDLARVDVHVHQETREVIKRDVLQDAIHHRFDHQPVNDGPVHPRVDAEVFHLHHAFVLGIVHLRLDVGEPRHVVVQDAHRGESRGHLALRVGGVVVHLRREVSTLASLVRPQFHVELHHLVRPERNPLPDQDRHVADGDHLVEVVSDGGLFRRRLRGAVRV